MEREYTAPVERDRGQTAIESRGPDSNRRSLAYEASVLPSCTTPLETSLGHPSFPDGLPAIIAEPRPQSYCTDCAWLAGRIRAGRHVEDYAALAVDHWRAVHS